MSDSFNSSAKKRETLIFACGVLTGASFLVFAAAAVQGHFIVAVGCLAGAFIFSLIADGI